MFDNLTKTTSLIIVVLVYTLSFAFAYLVLTWDLDIHPLLQMGVADLAATILVFIASFLFRNSSLYDPYWSVFPIFAALYWFFEVGFSGDDIRNILVLALISFWGVRLTLNWARGWSGLGHQDWRYSKLQQEQGKFYWLVSFWGIHLFPTILVFLALIPVYYVFQDTSPLGMIDLVAFGITMAAIIIETVADKQLRVFKKFQSGIMDQGLWSWSRHPNYFGEILFWVGLFLFLRDPFSGDNYWKIGGVLAMVLLFIVISIPMMEKRQLEKKGYREYQKRVSGLIPLPPSKIKK